MNNTLDLALKKASRKHCVDIKLVEMVYKSYWKFVRTYIESLAINDVSKEELETITTNFNLPYLGKLYVDYEKIVKYRKRLNYYRNVKLKENKADRKSGTSN